MLSVFFFKFLRVLEGDPLPVLNDPELLAGPRLPQTQAHLVRPAHYILKSKILNETLQYIVNYKIMV